MIPYKILPMFKFGPLHFNMYGVMFALGILAATLLAAREAKRHGIDSDVIYDLVVYLIIGIIIGARLFYVLFYWPADMPRTLYGVIAVWRGGLAFFGGFLGALAAGYIFVRKHKLDFLEYADIFTVPLVVGHIFGRLGGYFTGLHPGKVTALPWAIYLDGALRHPVVLYEIIGLVIIVAILYNLRKVKMQKGFLFAGYVMLYSIQRLFLDIYRIESTDPRFLGLTPSQHLVIILLFISLTFIITKYNIQKNKKNKEHTRCLRMHTETGL